MMKKMLPIWIVVFVLFSSMAVFASSKGNVKLCLPEEMEGVEVTYQREGEEKRTVKVEPGGVAQIRNLTEGAYKITIPETEKYKFDSLQVQVPMWDETEQKMTYDIVAYPKYDIKENNPKTGDQNNVILYIVSGIISLILVCIMSCHNHFKCGRMSHKYSRIWRK